MNASPRSLPHLQIIEEEEVRVETDEHHGDMETHQRICDFCGESLALLYCRADSARLCLSCDRQVHSANQLFTKHTRCLLCDACDSSPASILCSCSTDEVVVCQNCDSSNSLHDRIRRPLEGFTGCPSVSDLLSIVGFEDKDLFGGFERNGVYDLGDRFQDLLGWEWEWDTAPPPSPSPSPSFVSSLDDLIASTDSPHSFHAIGVPSIPKSLNVAPGGQYKEEMLRQLRELAKLESDFSDAHGAVQLQSLVPDNMYLGFENAVELDVFASYKDSYNEENSLVLDKDSEIGGAVGIIANSDYEVKPHHNVVTETTQVISKVSAHELTGEERDTAISRYKRKRKTRRYDKHVRYELRKVRAESRTRIKGRFAKIDH